MAGWTLYKAHEWWLSKNGGWWAGCEKELRDGWLDVVWSSVMFNTELRIVGWMV
jgi:hypothetical protein